MSTPVFPLIEQFLASSISLSEPEAIGRQTYSGSAGIEIMSIAYWSYISICTFLFIRYFTYLSRLIFKTQRKFRDSEEGMRIIFVDEEATPYSFFNTLFLNKKESESIISSSILYHELCHAKHWHSVDRIIVEFILILQWWNPLAHLLCKDLKDNHEYIADQYALLRIGEREGYVRTLIHQSIPKKQHNLLQLGFAHSSLVNRLKMIHSSKASSNLVLQLLLIVALLFTFLSCTEQTVSDLSFRDSTIETTLVPNTYGLEYIYPTRVVHKAEQLGFDMCCMGIPEYKSPSETLFTTFVNAKNYRFKLDGNLVDKKVLSNYNRLDIKGYRVLGVVNDASSDKEFNADLFTQEGYFTMTDCLLKSAREILLNQEDLWTNSKYEKFKKKMERK